MIVSDNADYFKAQVLLEFVSKLRSGWKAVLTYTLMSDRIFERMVRAGKHSIGRLVVLINARRDEMIATDVCWYR